MTRKSRLGFIVPATLGACMLAGSVLAQTSPPADTKAGDAKLPDAPVLAQTPATAPPADAKPAEPAAPAPPPPIFSIWGFDLTGHFDVAYQYLTGSGKFVSGVTDRVFDYKHDAAYFHALDLQFAKTPDDGWGGLLDVTMGFDANVIGPYGLINKNKGPSSNAGYYVDPTQAYLYYGAAPWSIIVGRYVTNAGAEVIKSDQDVNHSRSILFGYAIPFTHTGLRATYKLSDTLTLLGGVNLGWDTVENINHGATGEVGGTYTPSKEVSITASYYGGNSLVTYYPKSSASGMRNLFDVVATFTVSEPLTLVLNYDYGTQSQGAPDGSKATWQGIAGYANYQFNDQWRLSVRGEFFNDNDGYRTGVTQKWKEATLTLAYLPAKEWEFRAEVRADWSDQSAFLKSDGITSTKNQQSYGVEALYKF